MAQNVLLKRYVFVTGKPNSIFKENSTETICSDFVEKLAALQVIHRLKTWCEH